MAPLASGLRRLNTMYGKVVDHGQMWKFGHALDATSCGIDAGLTGGVVVTSCVPACMSDSWVCGGGDARA